MPALTPVPTTHDADWHKRTLLDFQAAKAAVGEPSPHMTVVNHLSRELPLDERLWRIGCYLVPYSLVSAEAIWQHWSATDAYTDVAQSGGTGLTNWLHEHWAGIHTRTERRMVRTPAKFARSLLSWLDWISSGEPEHLLASGADYESWWKAVNRVDFFGRYISIRAIEAIRRDALLVGHDHAGMQLRDIRSMGGDSPVRALTLFMPEWAQPLVLNDPGAADEWAEQLQAELLPKSQGMNHYVFAAMLCEYREAYEDGHQYAGRTIDQELEYLQKPHAAYWEGRGLTFSLPIARTVLFPVEALGEVQGWNGVRPDLSHLLRDHGKVWSDLRYSYTKSNLHGGVLVPR